jgi:hypothetical protein
MGALCARAILAGLLLALGAAPALAGAKLSRGNAAFTNTGVEPSASGSVSFDLAPKRPTRPWLLFRFAGLAPGASYELRALGVTEKAFVAGATGAAKLRLRKSALDFDVRDQALSVVRAGADVLTLSLTGSAAASGRTHAEKAKLARTSLAPKKAKGFATLRVERGSPRLTVQTRKLALGTYDVFVDGVARGTLTVKGRLRKGSLTLDPTTSPPLDFEAYGARIDVAAGAEVYLTGVLETPVRNVTLCGESRLATALLTQTGSGDGHAVLRRRADCERSLVVTLADVAEGDYDVLVGGVPRGVLTASLDPYTLRVTGRLAFEGEPDDAGELPLDFDPTGAPIAAVSGGDAWEGTLASGGASCDAERIDVALDPPTPGYASGLARFDQDADCEQELWLEVEDVAEGTCDVVVGGVTRGQFATAFDPVSGAVRGGLAFETLPEDPGEEALDFDPRGQLVELVVGGATVVRGSLAASGPTLHCSELERWAPLLPTGSPPALGSGRLRVDPNCRHVFRVEIANVPAGVYRLFVAGGLRGTFVAFDPGGGATGAIEFDTHDPTKPLLDFDPRGQRLEVLDASDTVVLTRIYP